PGVHDEAAAGPDGEDATGPVMVDEAVGEFGEDEGSADDEEREDGVGAGDAFLCGPSHGEQDEEDAEEADESDDAGFGEGVEDAAVAVDSFGEPEYEGDDGGVHELGADEVFVEAEDPGGEVGDGKDSEEAGCGDETVEGGIDGAVTGKRDGEDEHAEDEVEE